MSPTFLGVRRLGRQERDARLEKICAALEGRGVGRPVLVSLHFAADLPCSSVAHMRVLVLRVDKHHSFPQQIGAVVD